MASGLSGRKIDVERRLADHAEARGVDEQVGVAQQPPKRGEPVGRNALPKWAASASAFATVRLHERDFQPALESP